MVALNREVFYILIELRVTMKLAMIFKMCLNKI
jgi:hypothetical protein